MNFTDALIRAVDLILGFDRDLIQIIGLSFKVSLIAVVISAIIGAPLGAMVAMSIFRGRGLVVIMINALMGLPPVVIGLIVYMMLSRSGPFGVFNLLFTPTAMIIAQTVLITPLIAALTRQVVEDTWQGYAEQFRSWDISPMRAVPTMLRDARAGLVTILLAGFGRAISEVGAVMIVGGNIDQLTRVMTTAIALETSKGDLDLAMALGVVLLLMSLLVNAASHALGPSSVRASIWRAGQMAGKPRVR